jgi:hypothetical protein
MKTRPTVFLRETANWGDGIPGLTGDEICLVLTKGYLSLISREDGEQFGSVGWRAMVMKGQVYARRNTPRVDGKQKTLLLHREISCPTADQEVDHKDQHKLFGYKIVDNRRENLRNVSRGQNQANRRKQVGCSSRFKGVYWFKRDEKWNARIKVNQRHVHLGRFVNETEAAEAYDQAHEQHFPGIHEGLNFPKLCT